MADTDNLSQREIDSLLKSGPTDAADQPTAPRPGSRLAGLAKTVKRYDFRRPDKFSKEHLCTLQAVHESFARLVASSLSNQLRTDVEMKVASIDQGLYEEYVEQTVGPVFVGLVRMAPLDGSIVIEFGQDLGLVIVDRLLGGPGALLEHGHEVTDIELELVRGFGGTLARNLGEAWENLAKVEPTISDMHQDIQQARLAPASEVVIMVFMEVTVVGVVGGMSICTPFSVLEPLLSRLTANVWVGTGGAKNVPAESRKKLQRQLERTPTSIGVELGSAAVRTADLAQLHVGDVIRLEGLATRPVAVSMGRIRKWYGRPGVVSGRVSVQLEEWAPAEAPNPTSADEPGASAGPSEEPANLVPLPATQESEDARAA